MGRSESATASIGYRVSLRDLIESIHDEESCEYTYDILINEDVFIEDDNNDDNHTFLNMTESLKRQDSWELAKQEWIERFNNLLNHDLLIPVIKLADTSRWGYNREGIHGTATPVQNNFSEELGRLRETCPPYHTVSWIIRQLGG